MQLREARRGELGDFVEMERQDDTAGFILPATLTEHEAEFDRDEIVYLSIIVDGALAGFVLLALDDDATSIELRRIVVRDKNRGIGQQALRLLDDWCGERPAIRRIWLDVFEFNARGRHVYEKLGYRRFGAGQLDGRTLCLYEKILS